MADATQEMVFDPVTPCEEQAADKDAAEQAAEAVKKARSGLPLQLNRLPCGRLRKVADALAILKRAGIQDVSSVASLRETVGIALKSAEGFTSTYMESNSWTRTRTQWAKVEKQNPQAHCLEESASPEEAEKRRGETEVTNNVQSDDPEWVQCCRAEMMRKSFKQANGEKIGEKMSSKEYEDFDYGNISDDLEKLQNRYKDSDKRYKDGGSAHFKLWIEASLAAEAEIRAMAEDDFKPPASYGHGKLAMFYVDKDCPKPEVRKVLSPIPTVEVSKAPPKQPCTPSLISVHIGGAGCGMGWGMWQQLMSEHKIGGGGSGDGGYPQDADGFGSTAVHFKEMEKGMFQPRAILVDKDFCPGTSQAAVKESNLFAESSFVNLSCSNRTSYAESVAEDFREALRPQLEACDSCMGTIMTHSIFGNTGGPGAGGRIIDVICEELGSKHKKQCWSLALMPSPDDLYHGVAGHDSKAIPVQPWSQPDQYSRSRADVAFNTARMIPWMKRTFTGVIAVDNASLHKVCQSPYGLNIAQPGFSDYNKLTARILAALTSPLRIGTQTSASEGGNRLLHLPHLATNLRPYPSALPFFVPTLSVVSEANAVYSQGDGRTSTKQALFYNRLMSDSLFEVSTTPAAKLNCLFGAAHVAGPAGFGVRQGDIWTVADVEQGGQAYRLGVRPGMRYLEARLPKTAERTDAITLEDFWAGEKSNEEYEVTFEQADKGEQEAKGRIFAAAIIGRGVLHKEIVDCISDLKKDRNCRFVDYCPTGTAISCHQDPTVADPETLAIFGSSRFGDFAKQVRSAVTEVVGIKNTNELSENTNEKDEWTNWAELEKCNPKYDEEFRCQLLENIQDLQSVAKDLEEMAADCKEEEEEEEEGNEEY